MLTECKHVKPEKERKEALFRKCIHARGVYSELFSTQFCHFFERIFSGKVEFDANRKTKMVLGFPEACSPGKILKIAYCNGYFSAFQTIRNANFVLLPLISSSPNILHFVRTFSIYAWLKMCLH